MGLASSDRLKVKQNTTKCLREVMANNEIAFIGLFVIEFVFLGDMPYRTKHKVGAWFGDDIIRERVGDELPPVVEHVFFEAEKTRCIRINGF
jgi:hypothetical protein